MRRLANPQLRLGAALWLGGMAGVVVLAMTVVPQLAGRAPQPVSTGIAAAASIAQGGVLLALAIWAGIALSPPLGLRAPAIGAWSSGASAWPALRRQLAPASTVGLLVGGLLLLLPRIAPAELLALAPTIEIPIAARLLYGGMTEELLMRWGLMTTLIWLPWRVVQKKVGRPHTAWVVGAIFGAALLFGVLHLPVTAAVGVRLDAPVMAFIIAGNALPGMLFGMLYWRYGLEAAILAHALAHAVAVSVT